MIFLIPRIYEKLFVRLIILGIKSRLRIISLGSYLLFLQFNLKNENIPFLMYIPKLGFNDDVLEIKKGLNDYNSLDLPRNFSKSIAKCFLPKEIDDNNYQSSSIIYDKSKKELYDFYFYLFSNSPKKLKPSAILTGNFGYFAEQELFRAAFDSNIKTIALHKECLKTTGRIKLWHYIYSVRRKPFGGSLVLVYNRKELNLQIKSGSVDLSKTRIKIIGTPRIDRLHEFRKKEKLPNKHKVVLFGFGEKVGLPFISRKSYGLPEPNYEYLERSDKFLKWEKLVSEICKKFYNIAYDNPSVIFHVKLKEGFRDNQKMIDFFNHKKKLKNLMVYTKGSSISILKNTSIAIGFNSTCIFESIARGIPVIVPNFGECNDERYKPYLIDFSGKEVLKANTPEDLGFEINKLLKRIPQINKNLSNYQKETLEEWVGNADGNSNKRLLKAIKEELI